MKTGYESEDDNGEAKTSKERKAVNYEDKQRDGGEGEREGQG